MTSTADSNSDIDVSEVLFTDHQQVLTLCVASEAQYAPMEARFEFWFLQTIKGSVTSHITHIRKFDGRLCCPTPGFLGTVNSKAETKSCE
ncbi:hypothetical protein Y032_0308g2047 [Ancylostoma ceylanicum]|uniref:Uncharacterized protein n=1 Tax=Ancylostoma ceylanicum TaxID=53326 RepID=A0A016S2X9_9BILA|nr:hypothetical protein Y032_0308g2047 [Ancylostoma ceylanicum]